MQFRKGDLVTLKPGRPGWPPNFVPEAVYEVLYMEMDTTRVVRNSEGHEDAWWSKDFMPVGGPW